MKLTKENWARAISTLAEFGGSTPAIQLSDLLQPDTIIQLGFGPARIDTVTSCSVIKPRSARKKRVKAKDGNIDVPFISLEDLLKNKKAAGRDIDLVDIKYLKRVKRTPKKR